jgi:hypothetical protein
MSSWRRAPEDEAAGSMEVALCLAVQIILYDGPFAIAAHAVSACNVPSTLFAIINSS